MRPISISEQAVHPEIPFTGIILTTSCIEEKLLKVLSQITDFDSDFETIIIHDEKYHHHCILHGFGFIQRTGNGSPCRYPPHPKPRPLPLSVFLTLLYPNLSVPVGDRGVIPARFLIFQIMTSKIPGGDKVQPGS